MEKRAEHNDCHGKRHEIHGRFISANVRIESDLVKHDQRFAIGFASGEIGWDRKKIIEQIWQVLGSNSISKQHAVRALEVTSGKD